jgi:dTMP kinase
VFISFEGVDGCGKSTQVGLLAEALRREGREVLTLREPGGTLAAERVRELLADPDTPLEPLAELLLFCAARADLVGRQIRPALAAGKIVVCDRFTDSTLAYQGVARGLGVDLVSQLNEITTAALAPDLTIYLRLDPDAAHARAVANAPGGDRFEDEGVSFQQAVADAYERLARENPERIVTVDALGTPEQVQARVRSAVEERGGLQ